MVVLVRYAKENEMRATVDGYENECHIVYQCHTCGYGNELKGLKDSNGNISCWKWDRRRIKNKFVRFIRIREKDDLVLVGKAVPFYPIGEEMTNEYLVRPYTKGDKLSWRLYSQLKREKGKFIGKYHCCPVKIEPPEEAHLVVF